MGGFYCLRFYVENSSQIVRYVFKYCLFSRFFMSQVKKKNEVIFICKYVLFIKVHCFFFRKLLCSDH